jgi:hypothetical protein
MEALQYSVLLIDETVVPSAEPPLPELNACTFKTGPVEPVDTLLKEKGR